jgi:hypothetical protein
MYQGRFREGERLWRLGTACFTSARWSKTHARPASIIETFGTMALSRKLDSGNGASKRFSLG